MTNSLPSESDTWNDAPLAAMGLQCRAILASCLDVTQLLVGPHGHRDWRGIAALAGFDRGSVQILEERDSSPTEALLDAWGNFGRKNRGNVRLLLQHLEVLERFDIIDDIWSLLVRDVESFRQKQAEPLLETPTGGVVYDAYVCYTEEDWPFVETLIERLETPDLGIRLFIPRRDMSAGVLKYQTFYQIIERWCRKMIIVLSPEFLQSHECQMQQRFAENVEIQQAQQKLIPVIYKPCKLDGLGGLIQMKTKINFCKPEPHEWGWRTLTCSIKSSGQSSFVTVQQPTRPLLTSSAKSTEEPEVSAVPPARMAPMAAEETSSKQKTKWYHVGPFRRRKSSTSSTATSGFQSMSSAT